MNNKLKSCFFSVLLFCTSGSLFAQGTIADLAQKVDSLERKIPLTKSDTSLVQMRYWLGVYSFNLRVGYWDSLVVDAKQFGVKNYESKIYSKLAESYRNANNDKKAFYYYQVAYKVAESQKDLPEIATCAHNLSGHCYYQGNIQSAVTYAYRGLKIAEQLNDLKLIAKLSGRVGLMFFSVEEYPKALKEINRSLNSYKKLKDTVGIGQMLMGMGTIYQAMNNTEKTSEYYLELLNYLDVLGGPNVYHIIGAGYSLRKEYDSAYKYCLIGYEEAKLAENKRVIISVSVTLADILYQQGKNKEARRIAEEANAMLATIDFYSQIPPLAEVLKRIYVKDGDYKKALASYELYVTAKDSLASMSNKKRAFDKEYRYSLEKKENENKLLAQENQIQSLQLSRDKTLFFSLGALFLTLLIIGYLLFRQNKLKAAHQRIRLEQKLLRSQMNPHFVFNCLSSIQQFIVSGKNDQAEWYLVRFSKLIREFLETNLKESISVKEEVDILTLYLEMESLRFDESFTYAIHIDEKIDAVNTQIPLLMLQPFVENAIWHGLLPKAGDRQLLVSVEYDTAQTIKCVIEDNGVGRGEGIKKESPIKKKSLALLFIQQRIDLLYEKTNVVGKVAIIDKKDEEGRSLGTTVVIVLPLMQ